MIVSMTGFGKAVLHLDKKSINIELKTLNSKQQDVFVRLPQCYKAWEIELRNLLIQKLQRGKMELSIQLEMAPNTNVNQINIEVLKNYQNQLSFLCDTKNMDGALLGTLLQLPDVLQSTKEEIDPEEWKKVYQTVVKACDDLHQFRLDEGSKLKADFQARLSAINHSLANIKALDIDRITRVRTRIQDAVKEIKEENLDKNRFEQELIYYLEKLDINEEKVRLQTHLDYFMGVMDNTDTQKGKKLGFIAQEIGREINTIGSKANHPEMQKEVVQMKDELEKIKEQLLNCL